MPKRKVDPVEGDASNPVKMKQHSPDFCDWILKNLDTPMHTCRSCWGVTRGTEIHGMMIVDHRIGVDQMRDQPYWLNQAYICQDCLDSPSKAFLVHTLFVRRSFKKLKQLNVHK
jgi:hypothetical protein